MANVSGLRWFLSEVYEPYLAPHQVSFIVAGSIARIGGWPQHPRVFFIDQVEDSGRLRRGAGRRAADHRRRRQPGKTYEALSYGRPIVGTSQAFRGIDGEPGDFTIRDEPRAFADAVLDLITSAEKSAGRPAEKSRRITARANDISRYFRIMDGLFKPLFGGKRSSPPLAANPAAQPGLYRVVAAAAGAEPRRSVLSRRRTAGGLGTGCWLSSRRMRSTNWHKASAAVCWKRVTPRCCAPAAAEAVCCPIVFRPAPARRHAVRGASGDGGAPRPGDNTVHSRHDPRGGFWRAAADGSRQCRRTRCPSGADRDNTAFTTRRVADTSRYGGSTDLFQAEVPASDSEAPGLCTIDLAIAPTRANGPARGRVGVLRHSVPISQGLRLLGREVFGGSFELRSDGAGADLPPDSPWCCRSPGRGRSPRQLCGFVLLAFRGTDGPVLAARARGFR